jgi:hypothetical protein
MINAATVDITIPPKRNEPSESFVRERDVLMPLAAEAEIRPPL